MKYRYRYNLNIWHYQQAVMRWTTALIRRRMKRRRGRGDCVGGRDDCVGERAGPAGQVNRPTASVQHGSEQASHTTRSKHAQICEAGQGRCQTQCCGALAPFERIQLQGGEGGGFLPEPFLWGLLRPKQGRLCNTNCTTMQCQIRCVFRGFNTLKHFQKT